MIASEVIITGVTTAGTVAGAALVYLQKVQVTKLRLEAERSRHAESHLQPVVALPGDLPPEFVAEAAHAAAVRVFRKDFVMILSFRHVAPDALEMTLELSFTLVNHTAHDVAYVHEIELVPEQAEEVTRILRVSATGADLSRDYDESFASAVPPRRSFLRELSVSSNGAHPRNRLETRYQKRTAVHGAEVLFFNYATLGAEVRVEGRPADLEISVTFSHREGRKMEVLPRGTPQPTRWRLEKAFLPWQAMYVEWHKKSPAHL